MLLAVSPSIDWDIPEESANETPLTVNWDIEVKEEQGNLCLCLCLC